MKNALRMCGRLPTAPWRALPEFLIIGAAKAGTTAVFNYLEQHPLVRSPLRKEVYFFDRTWRRGLNWYRAFFPRRSELEALRAAHGQAGITGESTPDYLFHPHVPARIQQTVPHARLIVLLRNPVERAFSYWTMMCDRGGEDLSFENAVEQEEQRLAGEFERMVADPDYFSLVRQQRSYLARGYYHEQLECWLRVFPREQLLVLLAEDLKSDPAGTMTRVTGHLGLPPIQLPEYRKVHPGRYRQSLAENTRRRLEEHFRPHNERLAGLLGRELPWN